MKKIQINISYLKIELIEEAMDYLIKINSEDKNLQSIFWILNELRRLESDVEKDKRKER